MVLAALALVFAMAGTAIAGPGAISNKLTKSKVKSIARKQADKRLKANVAGSHVNLADNASNASNASNAANAANAANSDKVDGLDANSLVRSAVSFNQPNLTADGDVTSLTINAPVAGIVTVNGSMKVFNNTATNANYFCEYTIDGTEPDSNLDNGGSVSTDVGTIDTCAVTNGAPVAAGTHTIALHYDLSSGAATAIEGELNATFTPFGATGGAGGTVTPRGAHSADPSK